MRRTPWVRRAARLLTLAAIARAAFACATPPRVVAPAALPRVTSDPAAARDTAKYVSIDSTMRAFLREWRLAWQETEGQRPAASSPWEAARRLEAVHCHFLGTPRSLRARIITGGERAHAACPGWYPSSAPDVVDERVRLDGALSRTRAMKIWTMRQLLRAQLDSAARVNPRDAHLTRQRLRFALDAGAFADAWQIATRCDIDLVQCGLFRGLVLQQAGHPADADSTFLDAIAMMSDADRCAFTDVRVLLDPESRRAYSALPCEARAGMEARLWWLSDPLYGEPGNERRAEHYARSVWIMLLADLGHDGRQPFEPRFGGEAVREMLLRYGWPSHMYWGGQVQDDGHNVWLAQQLADSVSPYPAREYTRGRLHTVPRARAVASPFEALESDWRLPAPFAADDWPVEHFARAGGDIQQLPVGQVVTLRRLNDARFAWAADFTGAPAVRMPPPHARATLFQAIAPDDAQRVADSELLSGGRLLVDARVRPAPSVIGLEIPGDSAHPAWRTRFGARVPAPLSAMRGLDVSQPLLFRAPTDAAPTMDADAAIRSMYGAVTLGTDRRIGVYWESYGFAASDTVEIELRVARVDRPGVFERLVGIVGIGTGSHRAGIRVRELPGNGRAISTMEGSVPMQMRSVVLNVSRLARGSYILSVAMNRPGGKPVTAERAFALQ